MPLTALQLNARVLNPANGQTFSNPVGMYFASLPNLIATASAAPVIAGGAAGPLTLTGIALGDQLESVTQFVAGVPVDLTSEFSIAAADTITNAGGTNTTGSFLLIRWWDLT